MKTYEETLAAVLARRDDYLAAKEKKMRVVYGGVTAAVCCVTVAAAVLLWNRPDPDLPVETEKTTGAAETESTTLPTTLPTTADPQTEEIVTEPGQSESDRPDHTTTAPIRLTETVTRPSEPDGDTTVVVTSGIIITTEVERLTGTTGHAVGTDETGITTGLGSTPTSEGFHPTGAVPTEPEPGIEPTGVSPTQYVEIDDPIEAQLPEWFATVTAFEGTYDLLPGGSWPLKEALEPKDLWLHHTVRDENGNYVGEKQVTATFYSVEGFDNKEILALTFKDYDTVLYYAMQENTDATKY